VQTAPLGKSCGVLGFETGLAGAAAFVVEVVQNQSVDGGDFLKISHVTEAEHHPLS